MTFPLRDIWQCLEIFEVFTTGDGQLLTSAGEKSGMLLRILQWRRSPNTVSNSRMITGWDQHSNPKGFAWLFPNAHLVLCGFLLTISILIIFMPLFFEWETLSPFRNQSVVKRESDFQDSLEWVPYLPQNVPRTLFWEQWPSSQLSGIHSSITIRAGTSWNPACPQ